MDAPVEAFDTVLACPACEGALTVDDWPRAIGCRGCGRVYPVSERIPVFIDPDAQAQTDERRFRDALAAGHHDADQRAVMEIVGQHHSIPVMRARARRFAAAFRDDEWVLDLGIGWGWHWAGSVRPARLLGVDMSLSSLVLARRLLGDAPDVILVCADAAALPVRRRSISGCWSVQVLQHMPDDVLGRARSEVDRVLTDDWLLEISNLNPAWGLRLAYRLAGRRLHRRGRVGAMEVSRRTGREWSDLWRDFRGGRSVTVGFSELFFHPDLHFRPGSYPLAIEHFVASRAPWLASQIARQVDVRAGTRGEP